MSINPKIILPYDIRGVFGTELNTEDAFKIGYDLAKNSLDDEIIISRDLRPSSRILSEFCAGGVVSAGKKVRFIRPMPVSIVYYACYSEIVESKSAIMITASHNKFNQNGFKIINNGKALEGESLKNIFGVKYPQSTSVNLNSNDEHIIKSYSEQFIDFNGLRIAINACHGVAGEFFKYLDLPNITIFNSSKLEDLNYFPDPSKHMLQFQDLVKKGNFDFGFAFDGDADRLMVLNSSGDLISNDRLALSLGKFIIEQYDNPKVVIDVKTTELFEKLDCEIIYSGSGHSKIKNLMQQSCAKFGSEASGHFYFEQSYDDAIKASHILCLIKDNIITDKIYSSDEIRIEGNLLNAHLTEIANNAKLFGYEIVDIDGIKCKGTYGWFLVRNSNTETLISLKFEANSSKNLSKIYSEFKQITKGMINCDPIYIES